MAAPAFAIALVVTGCGGPAAPDSQSEKTTVAKGNTDLQGKITIDGSSTVFPISEAAASQFRKLYPNVSVDIGISGTGGGFKRFVKGETDVSNASRPIDASELDAAGEHGVSFVELPIAYDGLTVVVHPSNDWVDNLTVAEIKKIYGSEGSAKTWSQVRSSWPDEPIQVFSPGTDSGTFDYFKEIVIGKTGSLRSDMSTSEDDNVLVTGVAGSPDAIGFFGAAYYEENRDKLKAVPIINPETGEAILPSAKTIESGEYSPFGRPLFVYVNAKSCTRPEVKRFISYSLENASTMAAQVGFFALPRGVMETATENFKARKTGTHYVTPEGEKRLGVVMDVFKPDNLVQSTAN